VIYLDNAASTWPKPESVVQAVKRCLEETGANPGRSGHRLAAQAAGILAEARRELAELFGIRDPDNIFFFANATQAINQALKGFLRPGDHVVTTCWEHNAVARPLEALKRERGITVSVVPASPDGSVDPAQVERAIRPETRLIAATHGSNVTGAVMPVEEIGAIARKKGVRFLVDAAQTAGNLPIDVEALGIDMLAFPGHKGLYGPQGTGGLYASPDIPLIPLIQGGTGSRSEQLEHPGERPEGFESGTPNTPGIAGLAAGVRFVRETGVGKIHRKEMHLAETVRSALSEMEGVTVYTPRGPRLPVVAFNLAGLDSQEVAAILDAHYGIAVRAGYHCAALAHKSLGTEETGAVRASFGYFNEEKDAEALIIAIGEIRKAFDW